MVKRLLLPAARAITFVSMILGGYVGFQQPRDSPYLLTPHFALLRFRFGENTSSGSWRET